MVPTVGKLAVRRVCCTALPGGDDVSPAGIARIALRDTVQTALETEYLGGTGWPGLLDKHRDHDPLAVDALIYLLAVAFQSPKPTATVALARGLSPASGPKRVLAARKAGLLPETEPGMPRRGRRLPRCAGGGGMAPRNLRHGHLLQPLDREDRRRRHRSSP